MDSALVVHALRAFRILPHAAALSRISAAFNATEGTSGFAQNYNTQCVLPTHIYGNMTMHSCLVFGLITLIIRLLTCAFRVCEALIVCVHTFTHQALFITCFVYGFDSCLFLCFLLSGCPTLSCLPICLPCSWY